ncbi:serine/threonine-protein kinase [Streptomyces sp. S.PNR 29]|uniref:serine/threonine-protein kinase n=1 Tax=Streptomyces sp. S.PNR 29 TaxID=2973805 RepID=UPI0025AFA5A6|nr:serine/threonine-protein kinase [Streptomyces sp. S.PNR 29]MDN0196470.1 serine/threonine protein kinase [Streptomyces sp. S.PNR 29]
MSSGEYGQADGAGRLLAGRYRVRAQLGRGGMGVVWRAVDEVLGREVAVKELRTYTDADAPELADLRLRMQREARAAARVRHLGVVAVHDIAEVDGRPLIVMELVDGPSLDDVLRERGTLDPGEAAGIGAKVMDALAAAHRVGVTHRDVKPGNILLDRSGRVVLTDFGIATMEDPGDGSATRLTRSGELVGSLDYLAPERAQGADPGPASDIWALGATLYAAVEGASPFRRTSAFSTLTAIVTEPLPEPRRAGLLGPVLRHLLDKRPEARPEADQARELLQAVADESGTDTPTTTLRGPVTTPARPETERGVPAAPPGVGPPQASGSPTPPASAPTGSMSAATSTPPRRTGRLPAAAAVAVVLAAAGVALTLLYAPDSPDTNAGADATRTQPAASSSAPASTASGRPTDPEPAGQGDGKARPPAQTTAGRGATTPAPSCYPKGAGKYDCHVWRTAKSYTASGTEVGALRAGTNYFYCQRNLGRRETYGEWTNVWWAKTDDDSGNTDVYVSDVYIKGGDNDEPVPGLPVC